MAKSKVVAGATAATVLTMTVISFCEEWKRNTYNPQLRDRAYDALPMEIANQVVGISKETLAQTSTAMLQGLYWAGALGATLVSSAVAGLAHRFCAKKPMDSSVEEIQRTADAAVVNVVHEGQPLLSPTNR